MPHGHCYLWEPGLVGIHVISDVLIGLAYVSISITLYLLIRKIKMPFSPIVLAFGMFIGFCGLTHFFEVWNLWNANYWAGGWIKALTAAASVATGIALIRLSPQILAFAEAARTSEDRGLKLASAYNDMEKRVQERTMELEQATQREREAKEKAESLYSESRRANQLKDDFLATVSHELRTPLSVILGYSDILLSHGLSAEDSKKALQTVRRNAQTQSQLVNDLLDVSMIISGKMHLDSQKLDLRGPVSDAIQSFSLAAQAKNIQIISDIPDSQVCVLGDSTRLQQIAWNLISNAVKFSAENSQIDVTLTADPTNAYLTVSDTGKGIDPDFIGHVFERFSQEESGASRKFGGLGLGLGIVRHLAELHSGSADVFSAGKGQGARFTVTLPLAPTSPDSEKQPPEKLTEELRTKHLDRLRILVVDDSEDILVLLQHQLCRFGAVVETADSATKAAFKLRDFTPDLILCDVAMPDIDGLTFMMTFRRTENHLKKVPAIALTAFTQKGIEEKVLSAGFQGYLAKPIRLPHLIDLIRSVL